MNPKITFSARRKHVLRVSRLDEVETVGFFEISGSDTHMTTMKQRQVGRMLKIGLVKSGFSFFCAIIAVCANRSWLLFLHAKNRFCSI